MLLKIGSVKEMKDQIDQALGDRESASFLMEKRVTLKDFKYMSRWYDIVIENEDIFAKHFSGSRVFIYRNHPGFRSVRERIMHLAKAIVVDGWDFINFSQYDRKYCIKHNLKFRGKLIYKNGKRNI